MLFSPEELEEERRLWYVAMTRAKKKLFITRAQERYNFGTYTSNMTSRFITEIPEEYTMIHGTKKYFIADMIQESTEENAWGNWNNTSIKRRGLGGQIREKILPSFSLGDKVEHKKFGVGTIVSLNGDVAQIVFQNGIKSLNLRIAPLEKID